MSLLLGTIKSKFGFIRQFKDMSLSELDFTNENGDCNDYLFDDLDGDDGDFLTENVRSENSKQIKKVECAEFCEGIKKEEPEVTQKTIKLESLMEFSENTLDPPKVESSWSETDSTASQSSSPLKAHTPEPVFVKAASLLFESEDESSVGEEDENVEQVFLELEAVYVGARSIVVRADGFISTPLHAMKMLANKIAGGIPRYTIRYKKDHFSKPLVRVEFKSENFYGIGEAFNDRMAAQMAALDLLLREENNSAINIVPFALYPGWRLRPRVTQDLLLLCKKNNLKYPRYITKSNIEDPMKPVCLVECYIGKQLIASGESDLPMVARKLAAVNAIEELTGEVYPLDYVAYGKACMTDEQLKASGYTVLSPNQIRIGSIKQTAQDAPNAAKGVDELDAQEVHKEEIQQVKRKKLDLKITIGGSGTNQSAVRTVQIQDQRDC